MIAELYWLLLVADLVYSEEGSVRLNDHGNLIPHTGFVQVLVNQEWLDVAATSSTWTKQAGDVVCRQLGYVEALDVLHESYYCPSLSAPTRGERMAVTEVDCSGSEVALSDCSGFTVEYVKGSITQLSGVICAVPFSLRLSQTNSLEILVDYEWEPICGNWFDQYHAAVACRQLGYTLLDQYDVAVISGEGGNYAYANGNCTGDEFNLIGCSDDPYFPITLTSDCDTTVKLHCNSPPSEPCHVSTVIKSCDSASITWSFHSAIDRYYLRYRAVDSSIVNYTSTWMYVDGPANRSTPGTVITTDISGLDLLTTYEVTLQGSSEVYGNGTISHPIQITTQIPAEIPAILNVIIDTVTDSTVRITWEESFTQRLQVYCSLLCLIGFDIQLISSNKMSVTHTFPIDQLEVYINTTSTTRYTAALVTGLNPVTLYSIRVRPLASLAIDGVCVEQGEMMKLVTVYGQYSDAINITTLESSTDSGFGISSLSVLRSPSFSLSFFIATIVLLLILFVVIILCICCWFCKQQTKTKKIYQRRISRSDDNIYATGELSEQSYIPMMSSTSVSGSIRANHRISSHSSIINGQRSLWIDHTQPVPPTTFSSDEHINKRGSVAHSSINDNEEITIVSSFVTNVDQHEDEYYDRINDKDKADGSVESNHGGSGSSTEDENVYDEIKGEQNNDEETGSISSDRQQNPADNEELPAPHHLSQLIQSQDSNELPPTVLHPSIPPPRQFAVLPPTPRNPALNISDRVNLLKGKAGLSLSMCNIPLPPIPSEYHRSTADLRNEATPPLTNRRVSEGQGKQSSDYNNITTLPQRDKYRRKSIGTSARERCKPTTTQSDNSLDENITRSPSKGHESYYDIPPTSSGNYGKAIAPPTLGSHSDNIPTATSFGHSSSNSRSLSPEYEVLIHPRSKSLSINSNRVTSTRPSRPPPPIPYPKPGHVTARSTDATSNNPSTGDSSF